MAERLDMWPGSECARQWRLALSLCLLAAAMAGAAETKQIVLRFTDATPKIDGVLSDAAWQSALLVRDFFDLKTKKLAKRQTEVRILMTTDGLYFGIALLDEDPSKVIAEERPRDQKLWLDDTFEIFLYPARKEGDYYQFLMNPAGSKEDWYGPRDPKWNPEPDWQLAVGKLKDAWVCEVFVPFTAITDHVPRQGETWWLRFCRQDHDHDPHRRRAIYSCWVLPPSGSFNAPGANGDLVFISRNLVINGSFEEGPGKGTPQGWKLMVDHPDRNQGQVLWEPKVATDGKRAIILQADRKQGGVENADRTGPERGWVDLTQELYVRPGSTYQLTASVHQFDKESKGQGAYVWLADKRLKLYPADEMQQVKLTYLVPDGTNTATLRFRLWGWQPNPDSRVALDNVSVVEVPEIFEEGVVCLTGNSRKHPKLNTRLGGVYSIYNGNTTSFDYYPFLLKTVDQVPVIERPTEAWIHGNAAPFAKGQLTNAQDDSLAWCSVPYREGLSGAHARWTNHEIGGTVVLDLLEDRAVKRVVVRPSTVEISADLFLRPSDAPTFMLIGRETANGALTFDPGGAKARWIAVTARTHALNEVEVWGRLEAADATAPAPYEFPRIEAEKGPAAPSTSTPPQPDVGIYPEPRRVKLGEGHFDASEAPLVLVHGPGHGQQVTERTRITADVLREDLKRERGIWPKIIECQGTAPSLPARAIRLSVARRCPQTEAFVRKAAGSTPHREQGYALIVDAKGGVWLLGADEAGLFNGTRALLDLFSGKGASAQVRAVTIDDWPRCTLRAIMYNPTPNAFNRRFIREIARLRYNCLHGGIGAMRFVEQHGRAEAQALIAYCDRYFVQLLPDLFCVMRSKGMVQEKLPDEPAPTGVRTTMCISHPENRQKYLDRLATYGTLYNSPYLNIGLDEIYQWDNGARWNCCKLCRARKLETPELFAEWIKTVCARIRALGKKPMSLANCWTPGKPYQGLDKLIKGEIELMTTYVSATPRRGNIRELGAKGFVQVSTSARGPLQDNEIGGWIDNWSAQTEEGMASQGKFASYVRQAPWFWNPARDRWGDLAFESQVGRAMTQFRSGVKGMALPSLEAGPEDFAPIDLTKHANETLNDERAYDGRGWMDEGPGRDLRNLPRGRQTLAGVPFHIGDRSVLIENRRRLGRVLPDRAEGLAVGQDVASIVFLHTQNQVCDVRQPWHTMINYLGHYLVNYDDGTQLIQPLRYNRNLFRWDFDGGHSYEATVAWKGRTALNHPVTLYAFEWVNPYPGKTVKTIDFCASARPHPTRLALVAATAVRALPHTISEVAADARPIVRKPIDRVALPKGLKRIALSKGRYEYKECLKGLWKQYLGARYTTPDGITIEATGRTWTRTGEPHLTLALVDNQLQWTGIKGEENPIVITFPKPRAVRAMQLISTYENIRFTTLRPQNLMIETSPDGQQFHKAVEVKMTIGEVDGPVNIVFDGQPIKKIRITVVRQNKYKYGTVGLAYLALFE